MRRPTTSFLLILLISPALFAADTTGLIPLTELGMREYKGYSGGLYPGGKNTRPEAHERSGVLLATQIKPLDQQGQPATDGRIVLLSVGMSNATQEFSVFVRMAGAEKQRNPQLVIVDGAQGGMTAARIFNLESESGSRYWSSVDEKLKTAGVTAHQVQAAWIKEANAQPRDPFPKHAKVLEEQLQQIVQLMHKRFPNLKIVYLSSRIYGGYATTNLNPEPFAYESGFAIKWLIERQIDGDTALNFDPAAGETKAPWLSWGPYLWANGMTKREDGLTYEEKDFVRDGTHPSQSGRDKVANQLMQFFKTDSTARPWFVKAEAQN